MLIRVFYDANAIFMDNVRLPTVAGILTASASGNFVTVTNIHSTQAVLAEDFSQFADIDGNTFPDVTSCLAYLNGQFSMRRPLDIPTATGVAAMDLSEGMPVAVLRSSGQLTAARSDTYALCFVAGFAAADIASGFVGSATRNPVTMPDWTAIAGAQSLAVGQPYFLGSTGGLTLQPPSAASSVCSVRVGQATGSQTFLFQQADPITL